MKNNPFFTFKPNLNLDHKINFTSNNFITLCACMDLIGWLVSWEDSLCTVVCEFLRAIVDRGPPISDPWYRWWMMRAVNVSHDLKNCAKFKCSYSLSNQNPTVLTLGLIFVLRSANVTLINNKESIVKNQWSDHNKDITPLLKRKTDKTFYILTSDQQTDVHVWSKYVCP